MAGTYWDQKRFACLEILLTRQRKTFMAAPHEASWLTHQYWRRTVGNRLADSI
jgi:hypothetical protein